jgi:hypothetical protein
VSLDPADAVLDGDAAGSEEPAHVVPVTVAGHTVRVDPGSWAVGGLVGLAGALFLAEPYVGVLAAGGVRARPVALSALVLAAAFAVGGVVFLRRGRRLVGLAHAGGAVAWGLVVAGTAAGNGLLLVAGVVAVAALSAFLVERVVERRR